MAKLKVILYAFLLSVLFPFVLTFAQTDTDTIVISTYYPSPYGSYNQLYIENKLGIGITTPTEKLEVVDTGANTTIRVNRLDGSTPLMTAEAAAVTFGAFPNHPLKLITNNTERMRITEAGNVGIGTQTPENLLHVSASTNSFTKIIAENSLNSVSAKVGLLLKNSFGDHAEFSATSGLAPSPFSSGLFIKNLEQNANIFMNVNVGGTETTALAIQGNSARVGIGTVSPTATFSVVAGGTTLATAWTPISSIRWKTNIKPIDNALEKILALNGVYFDWKDTKKHSMGLIAEEVGKIFPELVEYEDNKTDAKSLDYDKLTALLIEGIKEQQKEIENLKNRIAFLEEKIKD